MIDKKKPEAIEDTTENSAEQKPEGSGIFTTDGRELPNIEGGYDFSGPGGTLGDNELE
jgi:hypothetical protein